MDAFDHVIEFFMAAPITLALAASFILYFGYKRRAEFSREAAQNTAASLMVYGFNIFIALAFVNEVNSFAQGVYEALHIPRLDPIFWDTVPIWLTALIGLLAIDFADYWCHRAMHTKWLWPTHAAHHSDTHVNGFTTFRVHFLETIMMSLTYLVMLTWLQMPQMLPVVIMISLIHNMYVHMDLPYTHGPLRYVIASPVFHRWHHADVPDAYGKNIANRFSLWDVLFCTYIEPGPCHEPMGALKTGVEDRNPFLILIYPAREWTRLTRSALSRSKSDEDRSTRINPAE